MVSGFSFTFFMYSKRYCSDPRIVGVRRRTTLAGFLVVGQVVGFSLGPFLGGLLWVSYIPLESRIWPHLPDSPYLVDIGLDLPTPCSTALLVPDGLWPLYGRYSGSSWRWSSKTYRPSQFRPHHHHPRSSSFPRLPRTNPSLFQLVRNHHPNPERLRHGLHKLTSYATQTRHSK